MKRLEKLIKTYTKAYGSLKYGLVELFRTVRLTEEELEYVITKYNNAIDREAWYEICVWQELSEEFIEKYKNSINWYIISLLRSLSYEFVVKYKDYVIFEALRLNKWYKELPEEQKQKIKAVLDNQKDIENLNEEELVLVAHKLTDEEWEQLCKTRQFSLEFIEKVKDHINWEKVVRYQKLTEEFMEKYKELIDFKQVAKYQKLSQAFIDKYVNKFYRKDLCTYQELSEEFIEKYHNKLNWYYVCRFQKLTMPIILKFKNRIKKYLEELKENPYFKELCKNPVHRLILKQTFGGKIV